MFDELTMTINGQAVRSAEQFEVVNPATGEVIATAPECSQEQLSEAMGSAAAAFQSWSQLDRSARADYLVKAAEAVDALAEEVGPLVTAETGKPIAQATGEGRSIGGMLRYFAGLEPPVEVIKDDEVARVEVRYRPSGVIAAITPWNAPLYMMGMKLGPVLAAGNTVVLKPSPLAPLATLRVGEVIRDILPAGVVNIVSGGAASLGQALVTHPTVSKVTFTGSIPTGKAVAESVAPDLKRIVLELGGNDPAIVLDDCDLGDAAPKLFWAAFGNCGQLCNNVKRIYAPRSLYADLVEALAAIAQTVIVGDGSDPATQMGPLITDDQRTRIGTLVDDARAAGGRIVAGGSKLDRSGYFFQPTIVSDVTDGVRVVDEEQFGPVLPVVPYERVDDAVATANAGKFGLNGSVWGADATSARNAASLLQVGCASVNVHPGVMGPGQPLAGAKWSGFGVEKGIWGLTALMDMQVLFEKR